VLEVLGPSTGGIRRHVAALRDGLRAEGWQVSVAGPDGVLDDMGGQDAVVPVPVALRPVAVLRAVVALRRMLDRAELIHAHGLKAGWVAVLATAGRKHRPAVVVTVHNLVLELAAGRTAGVLRRFERLLVRRADAVIAVSREIAEVLQPCTDVPVVMVRPVGPPARPQRDRAQVRRDLNVPEDAPLVVTVARLHPQKGLDVLLEAIPDLRARVPGVMVVIVGQGPEEAALRAKAARDGLTPWVCFAGPSVDAAEELGAADVVAVPSRWESGPLVVAEALELARPVVATPVGFVPDLVTDGISGRIVPVGDARLLADALADLLTDRGAAAAMGERGREAAERILGPGALVDQVSDVYVRVLEER
jgi:glycosyltransferase involved in cell wall biosynthesis